MATGLVEGSLVAFDRARRVIGVVLDRQPQIGTSGVRAVWLKKRPIASGTHRLLQPPTKLITPCTVSECRPAYPTANTPLRKAPPIISGERRKGALGQGLQRWGRL